MQKMLCKCLVYRLISVSATFCALCTVCHADLWLREVHNLLTPIWHIFPLLSHFIYYKNFS